MAKKTQDTRKGRPGNEVIEGQVVRLDYQRFEKKSFYECTLVYAGGSPPSLIECDFISSNFVFEGAAGNTLGFLGSLAKTSPSGRALVLSMLGID